MQAWDFTVTELSRANPHSNGASTHESRAAAGPGAAVCSLGTYSASGYTCVSVYIKIISAFSANTACAQDREVLVRM